MWNIPGSLVLCGCKDLCASNRWSWLLQNVLLALMLKKCVHFLNEILPSSGRS